MGTVFSAYPDLKIGHQAGRVHSNIDPISRLCCWVPFQSGPSIDTTKHIILDPNKEPLKDMYAALKEWFEEKLLKVFSFYAAQKFAKYADYSKVLRNKLTRSRINYLRLSHFWNLLHLNFYSSW